MTWCGQLLHVTTGGIPLAIRVMWAQTGEGPPTPSPPSLHRKQGKVGHLLLPIQPGSNYPGAAIPSSACRSCVAGSWKLQAWPQLPYPVP